MSKGRYPTGLVRGHGGGELVHECNILCDRGFRPGCIVRPTLFEEDRDGPVPPVGLIVAWVADGFLILWGDSPLTSSRRTFFTKSR